MIHVPSVTSPLTTRVRNVSLTILVHPLKKCNLNFINNGNVFSKNLRLRKVRKIKFSYLLQIPQWCVLAGFGIMHFLQTDTNGLSFFSCIDEHKL